ncbi:MAG: hypothetical protein ACRDC0_16570 [Aeromonas veronii]
MMTLRNLVLATIGGLLIGQSFCMAGIAHIAAVVFLLGCSILFFTSSEKLLCVGSSAAIIPPASYALLTFTPELPSGVASLIAFFLHLIWCDQLLKRSDP